MGKGLAIHSKFASSFFYGSILDRIGAVHSTRIKFSQIVVLWPITYSGGNNKYQYKSDFWSSAMKVNPLKILKISAACCIAILLADFLGLTSSTSAGIITLLSIQDTKKATFQIAGKRLLAFVPAVFFSLLIFWTMGFHVFSFGVFLFLFILFCYFSKLHDGITTNTVLISHVFASGSLHYSLLLNEFILLLIGVAIGVLVNLYMPQMTRQIRLDQQDIDSCMKCIIGRLSQKLQGEQADLSPNFQALQTRIDAALTRSYDNADNYIRTDMRYYVRYFQLRMGQIALLQRMDESVEKLRTIPEQAHIFAQFLQRVSDSFHEYNNARSLLNAFYKMRNGFKNSPLPQNREEFEARAILVQIVHDTENLLMQKRDFALSLSEDEVKRFWTK